MPMCAGGSGSSSLRRESELESRIDPPQGLVARERGDDRPELGTALAAGQREPQRLQVAADRLQLAHDRTRGVLAEPAVRALAQLPEALERRHRLRGDVRGLRLGDRAREAARLVEVARTAK